MGPTDFSKSKDLDFLSLELRNMKFALDQAAIVAAANREGDIIYVNDKFCEISQYSREELIGQNHRLINSGYHSTEFWTEMWKTISSGKIWQGEVCNRAKDGSPYWVATTIVPFLDHAGEPYQYVSIRFDITRKKDAEHKLVVYASRLEKSNRELQDFASIAAHDLQEPLRKVQVFSQRIKARFASLLPEEGVDYLTRMESAANRMQSLINDLLTYSRVATRGKPFVATDLNKVIAGVLSDIEVRIEQTKGKIEVHKLPTINADPSQIRQLFQNLILNGLKFHKPGETPVVEIGARLFKDGRNMSLCEITVRDQGIGFDEKYLDRIFTIFQRLHGRTEYEGTGVGLAVCRRIAERHGGTITARSTPDHGATFIVTLPTDLQAEEDYGP